MDQCKKNFFKSFYSYTYYMVQRRIKIAYINSRFIPVSSIYVSAIFRHMKFIEVEKKN